MSFKEFNGFAMIRVQNIMVQVQLVIDRFWIDEINQDGVISILLTNDRSSPECQ